MRGRTLEADNLAQSHADFPALLDLKKNGGRARDRTWHPSRFKSGRLASRTLCLWCE